MRCSDMNAGRSISERTVIAAGYKSGVSDQDDHLLFVLYPFRMEPFQVLKSMVSSLVINHYNYVKSCLTKSY